MDCRQAFADADHFNAWRTFPPATVGTPAIASSACKPILGFLAQWCAIPRSGAEPAAACTLAGYRAVARQPDWPVELSLALRGTGMLQVRLCEISAMPAVATTTTPSLIGTARALDDF
jgi:hypothetical protein